MKKPDLTKYKTTSTLYLLILIIAAVISAFSENPESTIVIIAVLIMNSILGTVQHIKS